MGIMTEGVIRMPYELAMSDELSRKQFYDRANDAMDELLTLRFKLAQQPSVDVLVEEILNYCNEIANGEYGHNYADGAGEVSDFIRNKLKTKPINESKLK